MVYIWRPPKDTNKYEPHGLYILDASQVKNGVNGGRGMDIILSEFIAKLTAADGPFVLR